MVSAYDIVLTTYTGIQMMMCFMIGFTLTTNIHYDGVFSRYWT